jgi:hypothetical protein
LMVLYRYSYIQTEWFWMWLTTIFRDAKWVCNNG